MESLRSVIASMSQGDFLASIDIKDAYLHVPIAPEHQRFLRFAIGDEHLQFVALPFGLATAPRVFTKVMASVVAVLHSQGHSVIPYLDDLLVRAPSRVACQHSLTVALATLQQFGWLINFPKSKLTPTQSLTYLGMEFHTHSAVVKLPLDKQLSLQTEVQSLLRGQSHPLRRLMHFLGKMVAAMEAVPFAQFHLRPLQWDILRKWDRRSTSLDRNVSLSLATKTSLQWWLLPNSLSQGKSFLPPTWAVVTTDASLSGWGAVFLHHRAQGTWTPIESSLQINVLEIRAVYLALKAFHRWLEGRQIRIQSDNATAVAYINHQGGTRSRQAFQEVRRILLWAEATASTISAVHIPGVENWEADFLSRQGMDAGEWSLHPDVFREICRRWGTPDVDLMASRHNNKVPAFMARSQDHRALAADALVQDWSQFRLPYVFPPLVMLPRVLRKIRSDCRRAILVAPDWPRRSWYPDLWHLTVGQPWALPDRTDLLSQGPFFPSEFCGPQPDCVAIESWLLASSGLSQDVIATMRQARKPTSAKIYYRSWRIFLSWCSDKGFTPWPFALPIFLSFLQSGMDKGLSLGSLKGQVSALSVFFQKRLARLPQVRTLLQGVCHIVPPYKRPLEPWDLNRVLMALQKPPFEPLRDVSLSRLSQKVTFLVAITSLRRVSELAALSCKSPFLVFHQDKVVLRPVPEFLPKVVSPFHLNQDISLPSFCPHPVHQCEKDLHSLDLVRALRLCVSHGAPAPFRCALCPGRWPA
ncbi:ELMO domain-containing protein 3 isoform 1-T2 [Anomaloglossus baeobatrachus]